MNRPIDRKAVLFLVPSFVLFLLGIVFYYYPHSVATPEKRHPLPQRSKKYQSVGFDFLADYDFGTLDWSGGNQSNKFIADQLEQIIPQPIKALDKQPVAITGFVLPVESTDERIDSFLLLRDLQMCCFGTLPELNEWVYVEVPQDLTAKNLISDTPIVVSGTFEVKPRFKDDFLLAIYSLTFSDSNTLKEENESEG